MEIRHENGKLKTLDELWDEAKETVIEELDTMLNEYALYLGNEIRDRNNYARLYENNEECLNEQLEGLDPYEVLNLDWDYSDEFFTWDGSDLNMTNDVWYDLDTDDIAEEILEGSYYKYLPSDLKDYVDEYEDAKEILENYNPTKAKVEEVIRKYVNCQADVTDLLQTLDMLARNDELWEE